MSLLDRWVANTKRVLAKDKNTGSEYEFESIFPDGAPDGTAFSAENMNKIIDAVNGLDESKGQPSGIATLDSSGKLAQMPTAADVGAVPSMLTDIIYVDQADPIPHYDNLRNYITPGQRVHIATVTTAMSVDNCPEMSPGMLEVTEYNHSVKTGQTLGIMQRFTSQVSGITYTCIHTPDNGYWSNWAGGRPNYINVPASGGGNIGWAYRNARGEVNLTIYATLSTPVNSITYRTIGALPEGYLPNGTFEVPAILRGSISGLEIGMLLIGSAGSIQVARALGSTAAGLDMVRTQVNYYTKA